MKKICALAMLFAFVCFNEGMASTASKKKKDKSTELTEAQKSDSTKKATALKKYEDVITDKASTMNGFFKVHFVDGKYFFEVPDTLFGRDILVVNRIVKAPADSQKRKIGYPGDYISEAVYAFEKGRDNKLFVRELSFLEKSTDTTGLYQSVLNSNVQPIVATFPYKCVRKEGDVCNYVVDMTDYINKDTEMFSFSGRMKDNIGASSMVKDASYIDTLKAFPTNIEVTTVRTYERRKTSATSELERFLSAFMQSATTPLTYELNSSMLLLPEKPMQARFCDDRVGYFAVSYKDFDADPQGVKYRSNITRWRLEPKDEDVEKYLKGELVEPKKPIVIYIDPATPKQWVPYLIQGVNDWQKAFEKAGFKNAIMGKEAPVDDPSWSLEDARYSAIVYKPSDIANASGPHVSDPRSGEVLETHVNWYHNVMSLLYNWYFVQVGAIDTAANHPSFDPELMGQLIRFVSSHEVGHTLGLRHNYGSSHTVPVENLRNKAWVEANGHTPSIMDYARFNYVAQPEDNISRAGIFPRIGIYDEWAIEWGYRWFPQFKTPEEEIPFMNKWIIDKLNEDERYTFGTELDSDDPRNQNEDLGNDAMLAGMYGIKNLQRILPNVLKWTYEPNEDYMKAIIMYQQISDQFMRYMGHVATNIGGIYSNPISVEQTNIKPREYVDKETQKRAMAFLNEQLFTSPMWLKNAELEDRTAVNSYNTITRIQSKILSGLLSSRTLDKLFNNETENAAKAYTVSNLFNDLGKTVWKDLNGSYNPDICQRNMQKVYIGSLTDMLDKPKSSGLRSLGGFSLIAMYSISDTPTIARAELTRMQQKLKVAAASASGLSKSHYQNLLAQISEALDPKK